MHRRFLIATPSRDSAAFIDETVASVLGQAGDFEIVYHVQDGGSRDGTLERLDHWQRSLERGDLPILCHGVRMMVDSRTDDGMYDAINQAFAHLGPGDDTLMGWINASDRLAPGALQTACDVTAAFPDIEWLTGRIARLNARGSLVHIEDCFAFPAKTLAAGLHDNRHLPFLQQEGSLWTGRLWHACGGLDTRLRIAGDFDLWRRFAAVGAPTVVNSVLGQFRHHDRQLGAGDGYIRELDASFTEAMAAHRATVWAEYRLLSSPKDLGGLAAQGFTGPVVQFVESLGVWKRVHRFPFAQR
ncbi:glycosyltransferase [Azospirillum formosense]|uniref:Glycosyltransferase n=2 Tax=Bacteria TaxID=2 RepID=A0ABX2L1W8_9PROT|nr:glycosyltransferase [Azospirillum formosense]MBY3757602.1 glycosyltransferase [Azospirillum formosense]NUB21547.1 glycosyltransferase [Azospirillum formosense]